jgi:hypothetical protein
VKGVSYSRFGGSDVLEYGQLPEPKLSQNSVIVPLDCGWRPWRNNGVRGSNTMTLARLVDLVEARSLRVTVAASFALADAALAQDALATRSLGPGKIVLVPDGD